MTLLGSSVQPLAPVAALQGQVSGRVTAAGVASTADIAATLKLGGGSTITLAETSADATTGQYSLMLPNAAPWVAP